MGIAEQLADDESAARLKDASQLAQRRVLVGHLPECGDRVRAVEGRVRVGKRLRVAAMPAIPRSRARPIVWSSISC